MSNLENLFKRELFNNPPDLDVTFWENALEYAVKKVRSNIDIFRNLYPAPCSVNNIYPFIKNNDWTTSFWTGMLWLSWEVSGDDFFRDAANNFIPDFRRRLDERITVDTHDLGFLYTLSCVASWKLTENKFARDTALKAADLLMIRYFEKAGIIQAWGDLNDQNQKGRIIIDCAMNLPLLYWASQETGNPYYREAAIKHIEKANAYLIRHNFSTFHTYFFNTETGAPVRGNTAQGYSDNSCWARGQAWGIYGNALSYRYTKDKETIEKARGLSYYFLNRLGDDLVSYWDLIFTEGNEERDSSASAIAACGLLELASFLPLADADRRIFENAAIHITASLASSYTTKNLKESTGLLLHGVYSKPGKNGVDECTIWGDYFYLEALVRILKGWNPYW